MLMRISGFDKGVHSFEMSVACMDTVKIDTPWPYSPFITLYLKQVIESIETKMTPIFSLRTMNEWMDVVVMDDSLELL